MLYSCYFSRQLLSKAIFESSPISPKTQTSAVKCRTPREPGQKHTTSLLSNYFQKRLKTSPTEETHQDGPQSVQHEKTEIVGSNNANEAELPSALRLTHLAVIVKEEPTNGEATSIQGLITVEEAGADWHSANTDAETAHSSSPPEDIKPVIKGEDFSGNIPVCDAKYPT